jgi:hypothetical protein
MITIQSPLVVEGRVPSEPIRLDPVTVTLDASEAHRENPFLEVWSLAPTFDAVAAGRSVLRAGHRGDPVRELQAMLEQHRWSAERLAIDGTFGAATARRVREFQAANGLEPDGIVGPKTLEKLAELTIRDLLLDPRFERLAPSVKDALVARLDAEAGLPRQELAFFALGAKFGALAPDEQVFVLSMSTVDAMRLLVEL